MRERKNSSPCSAAHCKFTTNVQKDESAWSHCRRSPTVWQNVRYVCQNNQTHPHFFCAYQHVPMMFFPQQQAQTHGDLLLGMWTGISAEVRLKRRQSRRKMDRPIVRICKECVWGGARAVDGCVRSVRGPEGTLSPHGDPSSREDSDSMDPMSPAPPIISACPTPADYRRLCETMPCFSTLFLTASLCLTRSHSQLFSLSLE